MVLKSEDWGLLQGFPETLKKSHTDLWEKPTTCRSFSEDHNVFSLSMLVYVRILQGRSRLGLRDNLRHCFWGQGRRVLQGFQWFRGTPYAKSTTVEGPGLGLTIDGFMRTKLPSFWNQKSSSFDLLWIPDVFPGKLPWCDYKMCNDNHVPRSPPLATFRWSATRKWPVAKLPWAPEPRWKRMDWCLGSGAWLYRCNSTKCPCPN